ncbi:MULTISPECIES: phenylacetate--CoA ligase family protein [unclassified Pseudomonas]|uniref:phenylacetate--CoA ligase family protein n=1 Tax=unclassified Pseudomonas TaxID=196821 RepID=UPI001C88CC60|nr:MULTISPECIES: AMP-binding protein [unclassified Pseudomonas]MBX8471417.1 AMP-binding protein [Pseudomonas sp. RIT778]UVM27510.1 AMP-binding protein [Pseudomonas sp. B21-021]
MSNELVTDVSAEAFARKLAHARSLPWFHALYPRILEVQGLADLHRLPVLAVEDESGGGLFSALGEASHRAPGGGLTLTSGGSTGNRKQISHSWAFNAAIVPLGARMFGVTDERPESVINCLTAGEMQGAFQYASAIVQHIGARLLPAGSQMGVQRVAELIQTHKADALICTPSFAAALFNHETAGLGSLKWLYYIGEPSSKTLRDQLARDWPALKIRSLGYSSTETGPIGFQCAHLEHGFYHLHADAMLLEVVDPLTLQAVAEEQTGEFLLTPLLPDHVPLLRYRIGDRGRVLRTVKKCACGSSMPVLALEGRVESSIKLGGALITQSQVLHVLRQLLPGLNATDVQVQIDRQPEGARMHLVLAEDTLTADTRSVIEDALQVEGQASALLRLPGVLGLEVKRLARQEFETTLAGKTPFFVTFEQTPAPS